MGSNEDQRTLKCCEAQLLLSLYLESDPDLTQADKEALESHLEACPACRTDYEETAKLVPFLRTRWGSLHPRTLRALARRIGVEAGHAAAGGWRERAAGASGVTGRGKAEVSGGPSARTIWRRPHVALAMAASLLLAVGVALLMITHGGFLAPRPTPTVSAEAPERGGAGDFVTLLTSSGERVAVRGNDISTGDDAQEILLDGKHRAILNAHSRAVFTRIAAHPADGRPGPAGVAVQLVAGEVYLEVVPGHPFSIRTDNAVVGVTGTILDVRAAPAQTDVFLLRGSARVAASAKPSDWTHVLAGGMASVLGTDRLIPSAPADVPSEVSWTAHLEDANALAEFLLRRTLPRPPAAGASKPAPSLTAGGTVTQTEPVEGGVLSDFVDKEIGDLQPLAWSRPRLAPSEELSRSDLRTAKSTLSRYAANFARISSVSFQRRQEAAHFSGSGSRGPLDDMSFVLDVEATRQPLFLQMSGQDGRGTPISEIVTPVGKISNGYFGAGESAIPAYLDGELRFNVSDLMGRADSVQTGVAMTEDLPGLEEYVSAQAASRYDVIALTAKASGAVSEYWFNEATGMLDYCVARYPAVDGGKGALREALAFGYQDVGGILYWKRWAWCNYSEEIRREDTITNLVVNGAPAQQQPAAER